MFVQLLIPVLILLAFAYVMTIFWANQKRWFTVLWIPGVACLGRPTLYLLKLLTIHGSGPDSGFVGMGIGFALIGGLPIIILFILTVIAYPRGPTWDIKFAIVGLILTIAIFMVWSFATTEAVAIQVRLK